MFSINPLIAALMVAATLAGVLLGAFEVWPRALQGVHGRSRHGANRFHLSFEPFPPPLRPTGQEVKPMVETMAQDFKTIHVLVIKPLVAMAILAVYFAGVFNGTF